MSSNFYIFLLAFGAFRQDLPAAGSTGAARFPQRHNTAKKPEASPACMISQFYQKIRSFQRDSGGFTGCVTTEKMFTRECLRIAELIIQAAHFYTKLLTKLTTQSKYINFSAVEPNSPNTLAADL